MSSSTCVKHVSVRAIVLAAGLVSLCSIAVVKADYDGFVYEPITEPILSATFSADLAALVAHRTVLEQEVNFAQLLDLSTGMEPLDLSDELFGTAAWPDEPDLNMGLLETGWSSAEIDPLFFPALESGHVGIYALFTDTDDSLFAIDTLILTIETARGTVQAFYGTPVGGENNGFGIGLADGGDLPSAFPGVLDETGTGFDEEISSKIVGVPEPGTLALLACLTLGLLRRTNGSIGHHT
jgi:hypothetical protein